MLYWLMGWTVFAITHRVVSEDKDGREFHQRREPDRWPRVVAEDEEGRAESAELRQGEPVDNGGHRMLADAEMQVFPCRVIGLEVARALVRQRRLVRGAKIRGTPEEPGDGLRQHVQRLARRVPPRDPLGIGWKDGQVAVPAGRQFPPLHEFNLSRAVGVLGAIGGKQFRPLAPRLSAARSYPSGKMVVDAVGHQKLCLLGPAVELLTEADLLVTERLAVGRSRVLFMRRTVTYVAVQHDERGAVLRLVKDIESVLDARDVVGITDTQDVPAVRQKSRRHVLCKGDACLTFDGDVVVVVDPAQVIEAQVTGQ